jgi:saccharopine dehydrogenase-like NADP-dependent oxidoreductase
MEKGHSVFVAPDSIFEHCRNIHINSVGSFETYPNRDCRRYIRPYQLTEKITFFRGLLRYSGWCDTMQKLKKINLFDDRETKTIRNKTIREYVAALIKCPELEPGSEPDPVQAGIARYLKIDKNHDFIKKTAWLGLYSDQKIDTKNRTSLDLLLDLMLKKMSYGPDEKDLIIVHNEIGSIRKGHSKYTVSTLLLEGVPVSEGAMARAVSLPAALASRYIMENKIKVRGVQLPTHREIYQPVLDDLEEFGMVFKQRNNPADFTPN